MQNPTETLVSGTVSPGSPGSLGGLRHSGQTYMRKGSYACLPDKCIERGITNPTGTALCRGRVPIVFHNYLERQGSKPGRGVRIAASLALCPAQGRGLAQAQ